jgi:hypothetical protein
VSFLDARLKPLRVVPSSARLSFGKGEFYYTSPVTLTEATAVGEQLLQRGFFNADRASSAHISREDGAYQLRFVIDPLRATAPEVRTAFRDVSDAIAAEVLRGSPAVVHLCDDHFRTLHREHVNES